MNYPALISRFNGSVWAIMPSKLEMIAAVVSARVSGRPHAALLEQTPRQGPIAWRFGAVGVVNIVGTISQRLSLMEAASGGVSTEQIAAQFDAFMADPDTGAIVLNIDSSGGGVHGVAELADKVFKARGSKRIIAVGNSTAASAAYWIGSAADEFHITPGGVGGSIGVYTVHADFSKANEEAGVKITIISAGKFKTAGNEMEPLTPEARDDLQRFVDHYYRMFVNAVAKHRGTTAAAVAGGYGEGRTLVAPDAVEAGLFDSIRTLEQVLAEAARFARRFKAPSARIQREMLEVE